MPFSPFSVLMLPVRIRQAAVQELSQEFFPHSEAAVQGLSAGPGQACLPEQAGRQALKLYKESRIYAGPV